MQPIGKSLGSIKRDVKQLIANNGEVREGFLDKTGFETLYQCSTEESGLDLAQAALSPMDTEWFRTHVDTLIYVTSTGNRTAPGNGHLLHAALGLSPQTLVIDLNDACTGFVRATILANSLLSSNASKTVLIVISDTYSKLYPDANLRVSPLFSDGASAIIMSRSEPNGTGFNFPARKWEILSGTTVSEGQLADDLTISQGSSEFPYGELEMNGAGVFNFVIKHLKPAVARMMDDANLAPTDVSAWYVHQGSRAVVDAVSRSLGLDADRQFVTKDYGNVVGSAIPFQILDDEFMTSQHERVIGLVAFGVGLTLAGLIIKEKVG